MNILMFTNTYAPHVGGVARSVQAFAAEYRRRGHRVLIVAPEFEGATAEPDVLRCPAIQRFNGSDFSVRFPLPGYVSSAVTEFRPNVVHAHHPFLLGENAVRAAASHQAPLVFTHHTLYEQYTHYVPGDSPALKRFVIDLSTSYANLCDRVFAPSESVAAMIRERGVHSTIDVVPTGVDIELFARGDRGSLRREFGIPDEAFVVGHVGRLAPEKNLEFLADAVAMFLRKHATAHFLVVGSGPSQRALRHAFAKRHLEDRLHLAGSRSGQALVDAYHAMNVFAFASQSETQGMVLSEAMAAGLPVVAIDAPGVRELVIDKQNGVLLSGLRRRLFASSLAWLAAAPAERMRHLSTAARHTAEQFSMSRCADRALAAYAELIAAGSRNASSAPTAWESAVNLASAEWELWSNVAHAAGRALQGKHLWKMPFLGTLARKWRQGRRWISRNEWGIRLLKLPVAEGAAAEPGLIMIQIDGFSRTQLEHALRERRMPFLRRLLGREGYQLHTMYSGLPSTTPAVQGELFYGVKQAVPAFSFREHDTGNAVWMLDPVPAAKVQSRLGSQGSGLLDGGSAYSNIYTGGAAEPHFCASIMGWGDLIKQAQPWGLLIFAVWNAWSLVRTLSLVVLEFALATFDGIYGSFSGKDFKKELRYVPSRVAVSILLRDLITIGAQIDATRGLPIIQLNYLGYDEQSHRRGPGSRFAHWSLKGIDRSIFRIWQAARRSSRRDYQVWIYSDHGQETTTPYQHVYGRRVQDAVSAIFHEHSPGMQQAARQTEQGVESQRAQWLGGGKLQKLLPKPNVPHTIAGCNELVVLALGPIGLIHTPQRPDASARECLAKKLVNEAHLPWVMTRDDDDVVWAYYEHGRCRLPDEAAELLGESHPFLAEAAQDLVALSRHPDAGDFVFGGWRAGLKPLSFPLEHGAHGGPGPEETRAFALLPSNVLVQHQDREHLRPLDLRAAALHVLGRAPLPSSTRGKRHGKPVRDTLRVMTYNVHTCIGMDGKLSPGRIARVIAACDPDIVCLQELDVNRQRTGDIDQAHAIARELEMDFHFFPAVRLAEEKYGDAILSRYPLKLVRADELPGVAGRSDLEPRGALWVSIEAHGRTWQIVNTHLGLSAPERMNQAQALLSKDWLGHANCARHAILCGDFNALPRSPVVRHLLTRLRDAQASLENHRPQRTFFSRYPLGRIDHVLITPDIEVVRIDVPQSELIRTASDHLPLIVELRATAIESFHAPDDIADACADQSPLAHDASQPAT